MVFTNGQNLITNILKCLIRRLIVLGKMWGTPPKINLAGEAQLHQCLAQLASRNHIRSASDVSSGGIAVALAEACFEYSIGIEAKIIPIADAPASAELFREASSVAILSCLAEDATAVTDFVNSFPELSVKRIGTTNAAEFNLEIFPSIATEQDGFSIRCPISELKQAWSGTLDSLLTEVHA